MFLQIDTISIYLRKYCVFSPSLVVENNNLMRLIVPNVCHVNLQHLVINMLSYYRISPILENIYKKKYIYIILFLGIVTNITHILYSLLGIYVYNNNRIYLSGSLGFSAIIFGLRSIYYKNVGGMIRVFGLNMDSSYAIWFELLMATILLPGASFISHLSGITAGIFIYSFI